MYETRHNRPIPHHAFARRVAGHALASVSIVFFSLGIGIVGYHLTASLPWIDSLLNASMILGGMGPIDPLPNDSAKLFASFYALYSGLAFITVSGLILAPFAHRILHRFHWEGEKEN